MEDAVRCYVVPEHRVPRWKYPYAVLQPEVWVCLVLAMAALVMVLSLRTDQGVVADTMTVLGVLTEGSWASCLRKPRRCSALIVLWVVFAMHFNSGYRAVLSTANVGRLVTRGFSSFREVKESAARILTMSLGLQNEVEELLGSIEVCESLEKCSRILWMNQESSALVMTGRTMEFAGPKYFLDDRARRFLRPLRETVFTFYTGALLERDSPLLPAVNQAVAAIRGGALYKPWLTRVDAIAQRLVRKKKRRRPDGPPRLDLTRTMGPFTLLATGLAASTCVFVGELLWLRCAGRQGQVREIAGSPRYNLEPAE
ncbi:uncharacterized protein LOC117639028 [Thrips palmi]|uniref:Uncharacterized protein LOC117639028 n=1 Tax=Thrips palmi TaxID=161013 RepID=A0A6P8Y2K7_THRPL|nr:uncharacterized protein LOC117639028 [Thrips palmi]